MKGLYSSLFPSILFYTFYPTFLTNQMKTIMKKILLYGGILLASLVTVSCTEDFKDWANPQSYAQGPDFELITAAANQVATSVNYATAEEPTVTLLTQSYIKGMSAGTLVYSNLKMNGIDVPCQTQDGNLVVELNDIKNACESFYKSKAATTRLMECTLKASCVDEEGVAVPAQTTVDAATVDSFAFNFITPELPAIAYEDAYYYIGGYNGWNLAEPTPMEKNEDGTFSVILDIGNSEWFCFAPQSAVDNQDWNGLLRATSNGDTSTSGFFNEDSSSGNSFQCENGGTYKFTISPKDWTFSYAPYSKELYYAGDANGWGFSPLVKVGDNFEGYYYIYKADNASTWGFKFTTTPDWSNPQYGAGEGEGTIALDGGNCDLPGDYQSGFYKISVNTDNLTFTLSPISVISLIGSAVNGDSSWGTDYDLSFNLEKKCWEGTYDMTDGEYKFRANHDWSLSWGGATDALTSQNGANLHIEAGNYTFELYPQCDGKGYVNITKN